MLSSILVLIWLTVKLVSAIEADKNSREKKLAYNNPNSPMHNWKFEELDRETIFPWEVVFANKYFPVYTEHLILCPICRRESRIKINGNEYDFVTPNYLGRNILTVYFKTPDYTWKNSYGQEGYLSICLRHKKQIDFDSTMMN